MVRFRLADSELAQYLKPDQLGEVLTGDVVHVYSGPQRGEVDVRVPQWATLHTLKVADLLGGPAVIDGRVAP